jgi:uncharacterized protein with PQ loop repeat
MSGAVPNPCVDFAGFEQRVDPKDPAFIFWFTAIILETLITIPQIVDNHKRKSATGLSLYLIVLGLLASILTALYAVLKFDNLIVLSSLVSTSLFVVLLGQKLYYDRTA